jgi:hypothetical protein
MSPPAAPLRSPAPDRAARAARLEFALLLVASLAPAGWCVLRGLAALAAG